jgi:predicted Ser/Thr protein kinase
VSKAPSPLSDEVTEVDPLRAAAPADDDIQARQARASIAASLFGTPSEDAPPPTVGRYELLDKLGAGGMGVVYRARDPELDRAIALKLLTPDSADDETARKRMTREARALARLSHPNVVQVYDVGTRGDEIFVAMEFIDGRDLAAWLREEKTKTNWKETLELFLEAAKGLSAAHAEGLVHRDFKPANVLVGRDGRVVVVDFGLARPVDPMALPLLEGATTRAGALVGTPMYMAPEQFEGGHADARSDQFAFCVALYHALYGARPFAGDNVAAYVSNVVNGRIVDVDAAANVPPGISTALRRGLSVDPGDRFGDMKALVAALREAAGFGDSTGSLALDTPTPSSGRPGLYMALAAVAGVALFFVLRPGGADEARADDGPASAAALAQSEKAQPLEPEPKDAPEPVEVVEAEPAAASQGESGEVVGTETGEQPEPVPSADAPKTKKPAARGDWCAFHEDNYRLLRRGPKKRSRFESKGTCYTCRVERRRSRIARLHPSDCGGYQLCTVEDCK